MYGLNTAVAAIIRIVDARLLTCLALLYQHHRFERVARGSASLLRSGGLVDERNLAIGQCSDPHCPGPTLPAAIIDALLYSVIAIFTIEGIRMRSHEVHSIVENEYPIHCVSYIGIIIIPLDGICVV